MGEEIQSGGQPRPGCTDAVSSYGPFSTEVNSFDFRKRMKHYTAAVGKKKAAERKINPLRDSVNPHRGFINPRRKLMKPQR